MFGAACAERCDRSFGAAEPIRSDHSVKRNDLSAFTKNNEKYLLNSFDLIDRLMYIG